MGAFILSHFIFYTRPYIFCFFFGKKEKMVLEKFLADVNDDLDDLHEKVNDFGTDLQGILDFKEYFEGLADKLMTVSGTMQGAHTPGMDDSIKTLKAKFKESYMQQDLLYVDLLTDYGKMELDEDLEERAQAFMKMTTDVASMDETPSSLQMNHLEFLMVKARIDNWLDKLEEHLPFTAFGKHDEVPNLLNMDKAERQERMKKSMPKLVKLNGGISALLWAVRGMNDAIVRLVQFGDMVKKIVEPSKEAQNDIGAMIFSGAHKVIPTLKRLLKADKNIEKFLKVCPSKVESECAKLDKWLLDDIDTKMTVLGTELLIGVSFLVQCFVETKKEFA